MGRTTTNREEAMTGRETEEVRGKMEQGCCQTQRDKREMAMVKGGLLLPPGGRAGFVSEGPKWRSIWLSVLANM